MYQLRTDQPDTRVLNVTIHPHSHMSLNLPALITETNQDQLKKLYKIILQDWNDKGEEYRAVLYEWFDFLIENANTYLLSCSRHLIEEYQDANYPGLKKEELKAIKEQNKALMQEVKSAKAAYEKYVRRKGILMELR